MGQGWDAGAWPEQGRPEGVAGGGRQPPAPRRAAADALRLDWAAALRWASPGDPWSAQAAAEAARRAAAGSGGPVAAVAAEAGRLAGLPRGPLVLGILDDAPLLGTLGNLHTAVGALALARDAGRPAMLCLIPPPGRPRPLYLLGRDGEIRRVALGGGPGLPADGPDARRRALSLLGTVEAVAGRAWPVARAALEAALRAGCGVPGPETHPGGGAGDGGGAGEPGGAGQAAPGLLAAWSLHLWQRVAEPFGAVVVHAALPPLAGPLAVVRRTLRRLAPVLAAEVAEGQRRLGALDLAFDPEDPVAALSCEGDGRVLGAGSGTLLALHVLLRAAAVCAGDGVVARLLTAAPAALRLAGAAPLLRPRPRFILVPAAEAAFARAASAPLDQGPAALARARARALLSRDAPVLARGLADLRASLERGLGALAAASAAVSGGPTLVAGRGARMLRGLDLLTGELARRADAEAAARARAWRHLGNLVHPLGQDQDEWLAAFPCAAAWGASALLRRLLAEPVGAGRRILRWPEDRPARAGGGPHAAGGAPEPRPAGDAQPQRRACGG